jgi:hypothetical protein
LADDLVRADSRRGGAGRLSGVSVSVPTMRVPQALILAVDSIRQVEEIARFDAQVVRGRVARDCWIFTGFIGGDGYCQPSGFGRAAASGSCCGPTGTRWW